ncbi:folylpolyglutamate synthase/dihydrofolate synthase family protein [Serpentinicella sp. ANB-PHB4]|uniref:bifunctional folylpolyglutamate synthase/dihydrofolate synthase n=1 Tax=Serpentinicella sp. ANB-PHB4 TaxID=3074076 RepID=UPI00286378BC|nr:folylpolyglutamate synthase/dihydrofolate synthase family protein [Serpentinicella sp. ANB-PHB4]MDR5659391.1 folylpolyglutamate synthase/dihydrofolate synthase family protein [Serpentinicella sp. ANB-PHB4]
MNYNEAMDYIKKTAKFGSKLGLDNMHRLLKKLDNPEKKLSVIHVAGTNGKGSSCAFISNILETAGYKVGLYTSPSIEGFNGRIKINGESISDKNLVNLTNKVRGQITELVEEGFDHPTEFEIVTAIAFQYFYEKEVDYLVLEVGLGGRLDATNVVENPLLSVITPIAFDHMDYLGDSIEEIAHAKAGIVKQNGFVVSAPQLSGALQVIKEECLKENSKLYIQDLRDLKINFSHLSTQGFDVKIFDKLFSSLEIKLIGDHQIENAGLALMAIEILRTKRNVVIEDRHIYDGLKETNWAGRFEIIKDKPLTIIDGAHNVHAAKRLNENINKLLSGRDITLVIGMLGDKDVDGVLNFVVPFSKRVIVTTPQNPRALEANALGKKIKLIDEKIDIKTTKSIESAVQQAYEITPERDVILFVGSLYMINEVRHCIKKSD